MRKSPKNETKRDRFKRLATLRTNEILKRLRILGNCMNRGVYEYTEEDINKIFSTVDKIVRDTKAKFYYPKEHISFKL